MDPLLFQKACEMLSFQPTVDAFASPWNAQCDHYWTSAQDGLKQDWTQQAVYANPPWSLLSDVVKKIQSLPGDQKVMVVFPVWPKTKWFVELDKMIVHTLHPPMQLYSDESGVLLPPPRWRSMVALVCGDGCSAGHQRRVDILAKSVKPIRASEKQNTRSLTPKCDTLFHALSNRYDNEQKNHNFRMETENKLTEINDIFATLIMKLSTSLPDWKNSRTPPGCGYWMASELRLVDISIGEVAILYKLGNMKRCRITGIDVVSSTLIPKIVRTVLFAWSGARLQRVSLGHNQRMYTLVYF